MSNDAQGQDPLEFLKSMWGGMGFSLPGMVTPTLDVDELGKRIADLKAVEGWLKMNLNMLQMTIQGLEMQRAALTTMQAFGQSASAAAGATETDANQPAANPFASAALNPALWPWNFMQPAAADSGSKPPSDQTTSGRKKSRAK